MGSSLQQLQENKQCQGLLQAGKRIPVAHRRDVGSHTEWDRVVLGGEENRVHQVLVVLVWFSVHTSLSATGTG